jgi:sulfur carrier protein ThiS
VLPWANYCLEKVLSSNYFRFRRLKIFVIVTIKHSAVLKLKDLPNRGEVELPEGITIAELLRKLGIQTAQQKYLIIYVNGNKRGLGHRLQDGDAVQLFLPIGGG